jgi:hypothetical protein
MYIIYEVSGRVNNKCELFIEMHSLIRGQGRETSQRVCKNLQKTPKKAKFLLTPAQNHDIISISRIIDPHIALALHFITFALQFSTSVSHFGAVHALSSQFALFMRGFAKQSVFTVCFCVVD